MKKNTYSETSGNTPLMDAVKNSDYELAKSLIEKGEEVDTTNDKEETPLMIFELPYKYQYHSKLESAIEMMSILINKGTNLNHPNILGRTVLMKFVNYDYKLTEFLIDNDADINLSDKNGYTPLIYAMNNWNKAGMGNSNNMLPYVELLVKHGAKVNIRTSDRKTPLMIASEKHSDKIVDFLIKNDADVNKQDEKGETALLQVFKNIGFGISQQGNTDIDIINTLNILLKEKADINIKDKQGNTPFVLAVKNNLSYAIKRLIYYGADIDKESIDKQSLFVKSLWHNDEFELSNYLLEKDSEIINKEDEERNTPLLLAIHDNCDLEIIKYLIKQGANINSQNESGYTPLMLLTRDRNDEERDVILYMLEKGANIEMVSTRNKLITPLTLAIINKKQNFYEILKKESADTLIELRYLLENDLYFERKYFETKLNDLLPQEITYNTCLLLLQSWSYFDKRIDVDKINKCIFLLDKLRIRIGRKINSFGGGLDLMNTNGLRDVRQELEGNLHSIDSTTFEAVLRKFIKFPESPQNLVKILTNFTIDTPIKYTTHEWKKRIDDKYFNNFDLFLEDISEQFKVLGTDLKALSPNLYEKVEYFICSTDNPNSWKSMQELKSWVENKKEPFDFPIASNNILFKEIIESFKNEIEIRGNMLQEIFLGHKKRLGRKFKITISDNLKNEKIYTDVETFKNAIDEIFQEIKKYAEEQGKYQVEVELYKPKDNFIELHIIHIDSTSTRESKDLLERIKLEKGDSVLRGYFKNLCDWEIKASYKNKHFSIDCFTEEIKDIEKPKGFTHIMRFYK